MNLTLILSCLLLLTPLVAADPLLTTIGVLDLKGLSSLRRVTKLQKLTVPYILSGSNNWNQFPSLGINFHLPTAQYVHISYHIVVGCSKPCHLVTRLMINKSENDLFRYITGNTNYMTNTVSKSVWMEKGDHFVNVDYRSICQWEAGLFYFSDWNIAYLMLEYFDI